MKTANKIVMTVAGLLLIVAACLKFYEMIDSCVPSWDAKAAAVVVAAEKSGEQIDQWKANALGFWESYEFFLIQIPLEFALGVWMVCGLFRKGAWIAGTLAYLFFIFVTIGKWVTGAESCGCFGQITVDPKITLFAMDIPIFLLLAICRPKGYKLLPPPWPNLVYWFIIFVPTIGLMVLAPAAIVAFRPDCIKPEEKGPDPAAQLRLQIYKLKQELSFTQQQIDTFTETIEELRKAPRSTDKKAVIGALEVMASEMPNQYQINIGNKQTLLLNAENLEQIILSISNAENQSLSITEAGQVQMKWTKPEPVENDTAQQTTDTNDQPPAVELWDWLQYVVEEDVREQLAEGLVLVLMYHHDCPTCADVVPEYSEYYKEMIEQGADTFKIAFLAMPPYSEEGPVPEDTTCILGTLTDEQNWQVMSPYVVFLLDGEKVKDWQQGIAPEAEKILDEVFEEK